MKIGLRSNPASSPSEAAPDSSAPSPRVVTRLTVAAIAALIYLPALNSVGLRTDTAAHIRFAQALGLSGESFAPYYLFEQLVIIVRALVPFGAIGRLAPQLVTNDTTWNVSALIVLMVAVGFLADLVHLRITTSWSHSHSKTHTYLAAAATIALLMVAPITLVTVADHNLIVGYIGVTSYENASLILLRPLAFLLLLRVAPLLSAEQGESAHLDWKQVAVLAAISLAAIHAKPSYTVCIVPAIALIAALRRKDLKRGNLGTLTAGVMVPSALGLLYQYLLARGQGKLAIRPFSTIESVLATRGHSVWMFAPFLLLSILFPLVVTLLYPERARRSTTMLLAWVGFGVGLALYILLAVEGRPDSGDLIWGPQVMLFLLFIEACRLFIREARSDAWQARSVVPAVIFALHVVSGMILYVAEISAPAQWW